MCIVIADSPGACLRALIPNKCVTEFVYGLSPAVFMSAGPSPRPTRDRFWQFVVNEPRSREDVPMHIPLCIVLVPYCTLDPVFGRTLLQDCAGSKGHWLGTLRRGFFSSLRSTDNETSELG